jgi:two-component system, OmpR family, response regulator AdeR
MAWQKVEEPAHFLNTISTIGLYPIVMTDNALILIVEDEPDIATIIAGYLEREGFRTVRAADGEIALQHHLSLKPDLVLLDVNLPKKDGFAVLAELRRRGETPVIFVTALAEDIDKLTALRIGADDYVVKPFNPAEVVARTKAVLRRFGAGERVTVLRHGKIEIDLDAHAAYLMGEAGRASVTLTLSEFRILAHMIRAPARAFTRSELLDVCMPDSDALERTVDSHVSNLRKKLEAGGSGAILAGVRGVGYRLAGEA